jgi:hypothetical protein
VLRTICFRGLQLLALLSDEQFGVTNEIDEQDVSDLELGLVSILGGHRWLSFGAVREPNCYLSGLAASVSS